MEDRTIRLRYDGRVESFETTEGVWKLDRSRDAREYIPMLAPHDQTEDSPDVRNGKSVNVACWQMRRALVDLVSAALNGSSYQDIISLFDTYLDTTGVTKGFFGGDSAPLITIAEASLYEVFRMEGLNNDTKDAWAAQFTTDALWTQLKCLLFPHLATDGEIDYSGWLALKGDVLSVLGNTYSSFGYAVNGYLDILGRIGLTNYLRLPIAGNLQGEGFVTYEQSPFTMGECS